MQHYPQGQGLLETVVALGIIGTGLVAAITLTTSSFAASREGLGRLVATNLAREGVEAVRALRDTAMMTQTPLPNIFEPAGGDHTAIPIFSSAGNVWSLDYGADKISEDASRVVQAGSLLLQPGTISGTATPYRRLLRIAPICRDRATGKERVETVFSCTVGETRMGYQAVSEVQWTAGANTRAIKAETWLYDWR